MENLEESSIEKIELKKAKIQTLSINKFILLIVITFGLYQTWWIYKSWRFFREKENSTYNPAFKTLFSIFFLIPLFNKIIKLARNHGYTHDYSSVLLFIGFLLFCLTCYLPQPLFFVALLSFIFLIPPYIALNFAMNKCEEYNVEEQESFNGRQIFLLIVGGLWWLLVLIGLFL